MSTWQATWVLLKDWIKTQWGFILGGLIGLALAACLIVYLERRDQEYRATQRADAALTSAKADLNKYVQAMQDPVPSRVRERVLLTVIRHRAIARMTRDGFGLVDGNRAPLTREQAEKLYDRLGDDVVIGCVREASPDTFGKLGGGELLANLLKWIADHQDEILAILKLILSILALMG